MIAVHRITQPDHELYVNPDLIQIVEANPDTVIVLTNGSKFVVSETPAEVARARPRLARRHRRVASGGHTRPSRERARRFALRA